MSEVENNCEGTVGEKLAWWKKKLENWQRNINIRLKVTGDKHCLPFNMSISSRSISAIHLGGELVIGCLKIRTYPFRYIQV